MLACNDVDDENIFLRRARAVQVDKFKDAKEEYEQKLEDLQERLECATMAETMRDAGDQVEVGLYWCRPGASPVAPSQVDECCKQAYTDSVLQDYIPWAIVKHLHGKLQEIDDGMKDYGPAARDQFQEQMAAVDHEMKQLEEQEQELVCCC